MVDTRDEYLSLQSVYLPIAVGVWVLFVAVVAFAVIRYRRRDGRAASQTRGHPRLEAGFAALLALVAAFLCVLTFRVDDRITGDVRASSALKVHVVAARWNWRFVYPDLGVTSAAAGRAPATLVVPEDTVVRFTGTSLDVIHSFWVPERRFKRDVFPRGVTSWNLRWPDTGWDSSGECAEFCGLDHANMRFTVRVVTREEFDRWVEERRRA